MIARALIASLLVVGLTSLGYAQETAPVPAEAVVGNAVAPAGEAVVASRPPAAPVVVDPKDYRIGPEDVLDISVWKNLELSKIVPVRPDGKISLPLVHDIVVSGLTANELRAQLTERLSPYIQAPEVSVSVREVHSFKVSVQGTVKMPGQYEVKSTATVLDMLARAQGFTDFADKGSVRVLRTINGKTQVIKIKYNDAIDGHEGANPVVQPGDIIVVN
jgi:polysaccharide export outer membrane protein